MFIIDYGSTDRDLNEVPNLLREHIATSLEACNMPQGAKNLDLVT